MRIYQPKNEFGKDLITEANLVSSTKVFEVATTGVVTITKAQLGTDDASLWTVISVLLDGQKMLADIETTTESIVVNIGTSGKAKITVTNKNALSIKDKQQG